MRFIIELRDGNWLGSDALNPTGGTDSLVMARQFRSLDEARMYARHVGIGWYDLWTSDGEMWCGDHALTIKPNERRPGDERARV